ncbi:hypothetical protein N9811_00395 [Bacteroidia bacterium]|nr:hypothetical protein [Bacteroidia bacterium]
MSLAQLIENNEVLLLFIVISLGVLVGSIKFRGKSLGVSMVLFVGILMGSLNTDFKVSEIILILGISIFLYSVGLNSGPIFFQSYKKNGMRDILFALTTIVLVALLAIALSFAFGFDVASLTGIYAGTSTNTPAFASVLEYLQGTAETSGQMSNLVVSYTLAYPIGIVGSILGIIFMQWLLKIDFKAEYKRLRTQFPLDNNLTSVAVEITQEDATGIAIRHFLQGKNWNLKFGRVWQEEKLSLVHWETRFSIGDKVMLLGSEEDVKEAIEQLGDKIPKSVFYKRDEFDSRRIFLSNPKLAGRTLASLDLPQKYNALVTRIRRGDNDMLAHGGTVLELGDRIRIVAARAELKELSAYFGDSYHQSSQINLVSFGFGLVLGLLLGTIDIPIWDGLTVHLGFAGGPLVMGLILGALKRTGPVLWTLPYSTSVVIQQLGLMFLLAYIGVNNGALFVQSLSMESIKLVLAAFILSISSSLIILSVGYKIAKIPFSLLMGMVSNQPAVFEFANERAGSKIPQMGYALILPIVLIIQLIITQAMYLILS